VIHNLLPQSHNVVALVAILVLVVIAGATVSGQNNDNTVGEFWPTLSGHIQFSDNWRLLPFLGLRKGEDYPYQQFFAGFGLGYQLKRITKPHWENIDRDKEYTFVFGGGYERLQTANAGKTSEENRLALQAVAALRPTSRLLASDRNRVEFRWGRRRVFDSVPQFARRRV